MRVVASLCSQRINNRRDVDLSGRVHFLVNVGWNMLAALLQEGDVRRIA